MSNLTLYYRPFCPFCRKVLDFMEQNKIEVPLKNVSEGTEVRDELFSIGGKSQVPCLLIDGKALYESDAIIDWLGKNYVQ